MIPEAAVEAAARQLAHENGEDYDDLLAEIADTRSDGNGYLAVARAILEAAAPHVEAEADLMRWKLDALKEWADAMINTSNSPQYGRDVRTLLNVASLGEAREIDYL